MSPTRDEILNAIELVMAVERLASPLCRGHISTQFPRELIDETDGDTEVFGREQTFTALAFMLTWHDEERG